MRFMLALPEPTVNPYSRHLLPSLAPAILVFVSTLNHRTVGVGSFINLAAHIHLSATASLCCPRQQKSRHLEASGVE